MAFGINISRGFFEEKKVTRLECACEEKGLDFDAVVYSLWCLWLYAARQHPKDGHLADYTPRELAKRSRWKGDPQLLIQILTERHWLDPDGAGGYFVHDWDEHEFHLTGFEEAGRKGGLKSGEVRRQKALEAKEPPDLFNPPSEGGSRGVRTPTNPTQLNSTHSNSTQRITTPPSPPPNGASPAPLAGPSRAVRIGGEEEGIAARVLQREGGWEEEEVRLAVHLASAHSAGPLTAVRTAVANSRHNAKLKTPLRRKAYVQKCLQPGQIGELRLRDGAQLAPLPGPPSEALGEAVSIDLERDMASFQAAAWSWAKVLAEGEYLERRTRFLANFKHPDLRKRFAEDAPRTNAKLVFALYGEHLDQQRRQGGDLAAAVAAMPATEGSVR
jgi:hypothetical protein